ncbi:unnamed protein product [Clonostachys solani]|uniref:Ysc84 actin-binding domain-containing protein n=1 Tax=Clonostachys solani TaxID=160281 RepID=A0A9N9Z1Y1_9HYPO|nr:unnamed protein product [Clonostachys solani]
MTWENSHTTDLAVRCSSALQILQDVLKNRDAISKKDLEEAHGLVIFDVKGIAVGTGFAHGSGLVMARHAKGDWSLPSSVSRTYVGAGPSLGANLYSSARVLNKEAFEKCFIEQRWEYGMNLSAAAGPFGANVDVKGQSLIQHPTRSKGAYFGVTFGGTLFEENKELNAKFYGKEISAREILTGKIQVSEACKNEVRSLWDFLTSLEKQIENEPVQ